MNSLFLWECEIHKNKEILDKMIIDKLYGKN